MTVRIVFFSGTGCTKYVAGVFANEFAVRGHGVQLQELRAGMAYLEAPCDFLVVCYVVHACNAPRPVMDWISAHAKVAGIPAAVISVSGGGEVTPNLACRIPLKKKLRSKGFDVRYEKMIVMPSNWIVATKPVLVNAILKTLPYKVSFIVRDILGDARKKIGAGPGNRILTAFGKLEHVGARQFGRAIRTSSDCTGCGICEKGCPVGNVSTIEGRPRFGKDCIMCLNCIYGCPKKALAAGIGKFVVIGEGFSFDQLLRNMGDPGDVDIRKETEGFVWLGVRRYLLDRSDTLDPASAQNGSSNGTGK